MVTYLGIREASTDAPNLLDYINDQETERNKFSTIHLLLADTEDESAEDILADSNLPDLGDTVDGMYVHKRTMKETASVVHPGSSVPTILWEVKVEGDDKWVESQTSGGSTSQTSAELLSALPVESWSSVIEDEVLHTDLKTGKPWTTVVGEPIIVTRKAFYPLLTIQRIEEHPFNPMVIHNYSNRTNEKPFRGVQPGWALLLPPEAEPFQHGNTILEKVTYKVKFRTEPMQQSGTTYGLDGQAITTDDLTPFMLRVLHQGTMHYALVPQNPPSPPLPAKEPSVWLDHNGNPGVVNLTMSGVVNTDKDNMIFLAGWQHLQADFSTLGL